MTDVPVPPAPTRRYVTVTEAWLMTALLAAVLGACCWSLIHYQPLHAEALSRDEWAASQERWKAEFAALKADVKTLLDRQK